MPRYLEGSVTLLILVVVILLLVLRIVIAESLPIRRKLGTNP